MPGQRRRYRYVGPPEIAAVALRGGAGRLIRSADEFHAWIGSVETRELAEAFSAGMPHFGQINKA
ncbi:hypothetical protein ABZ807_30845 [Micromonospora sp. NPDC047548]|uniref:hypothetical protein n=1 Tax=Micromonospora sp. NPDC047548 TaxID=3155624 RepID=UPI0033C55835